MTEQENLRLSTTLKPVLKGVDSGVSKIPRIFHQTLESLTPSSVCVHTNLSIPTVIDLENVGNDLIRREEIVNEVRDAPERWGFFQLVNHGIPLSILEELEADVRRFFEQETEVKKEFYMHDPIRLVRYNSNFYLFTSPAANWRDAIFCSMAPNPPMPEDLPVVCRGILMGYSKQVEKLAILLLELLSEALGLYSNYLKDTGRAKGHALLCHYSPLCRERELTSATSKQADSCFVTMLLQDHIGGPQVLHEDRWIDVHPIPGALVVNIGDLLQLVSNDRFKRFERRVLANHKGPRVSVAGFFRTDFHESSMKTYDSLRSC